VAVPLGERVRWPVGAANRGWLACERTRASDDPGSRWSARSGARTYDLDAGEERRILALGKPVPSMVQLAGLLAGVRTRADLLQVLESILEVGRPGSRVPVIPSPRHGGME